MPMFLGFPSTFSPNNKCCKRGDSLIPLYSLSALAHTSVYLHRDKRTQWAGGMAAIYSMQDGKKVTDRVRAEESAYGALCLLGTEASHEEDGNSRMEMALS